MKKVMLVAVAGVVGLAIWRKLESEKAEQALWAEATDDVK